jgi:hypothetical protein
MSMLSDPLITLPIVCGLALLLFGAAVHKGRRPDVFAVVLESYGILPAALAAPLRYLIPWLEAALAFGLLVPATRRCSALASAGLLLIYGAVMATTLWRGRRIADCGCGVGNRANPVSAALVWRNAVLVLLATLLAFSSALQSAERSLGMVDLTLVFLATLIGCTFYALANSLIATQHSSRDLFHD